MTRSVPSEGPAALNDQHVEQAPLPASLDATQLDELRGVLRQHQRDLQRVAKRFTPVVNQLVVSFAGCYAERCYGADAVNVLLDALGLAIRCPETRLPARLYGNSCFSRGFFRAHYELGVRKLRGDSYVHVRTIRFGEPIAVRLMPRYRVDGLDLAALSQVPVVLDPFAIPERRLKAPIYVQRRSR